MLIGDHCTQHVGRCTEGRHSWHDPAPRLEIQARSNSHELCSQSLRGPGQLTGMVKFDGELALLPPHREGSSIDVTIQLSAASNAARPWPRRRAKQRRRAVHGAMAVRADDPLEGTERNGAERRGAAQLSPCINPIRKGWP